MFFTLIRKELRLHRTILIVALAVALLAELIIPSITLYFMQRRYAEMGIASSLVEYRQSFHGGAMLAIVTACVFVAILGAASQTTERRERWGEVTAMLPISRLRRVLATLAFAGTASALLWGFHALVIALTAGLLGGDRSLSLRFGQEASELLCGTGLFSVAVFGVAWLGAAFMRNTSLLVTIATGGVLAVGILVANYGVIYGRVQVGRFVVEPSFINYLIVAATVGVIATVAGTILSAKRVEP